MLFSEPKIPQWRCATLGITVDSAFQCSSASRKFLNRAGRLCFRQRRLWFQCSSASRKFLNGCASVYSDVEPDVSVLFSEPKIPQSYVLIAAMPTMPRFSALQRAENSSINNRVGGLPDLQSFSALQRAENSSITKPSRS